MMDAREQDILGRDAAKRRYLAPPVTQIQIAGAVECVAVGGGR